MKLRWKKNGDNGAFSISFDSSKNFEEQVEKISVAIDQYEAAHLSSQTADQIQKAIDNLVEQNFQLQKTCDDNEMTERY
jgi:hypothetical protein